MEFIFPVSVFVLKLHITQSKLYLDDENFEHKRHLPSIQLHQQINLAVILSRFTQLGVGHFDCCIWMAIVILNIIMCA